MSFFKSSSYMMFAEISFAKLFWCWLVTFYLDYCLLILVYGLLRVGTKLEL
jgi:hypothetical protein